MRGKRKGSGTTNLDRHDGIGCFLGVEDLFASSTGKGELLSLSQRGRVISSHGGVFVHLTNAFCF